MATLTALKADQIIARLAPSSSVEFAATGRRSTVRVNRALNGQLRTTTRVGSTLYQSEHESLKRITQLIAVALGDNWSITN